MDVYILDSLLRRIDVVDKYESLIWTERYSEEGDFKLVLVSTFENRSRFTEGTLLATNDSYRVMEVTTVEDVYDSEGKSLLKVNGFSLEKILRDRVAKETLSDLTTEPKWIFDDTPGDIAREMFDHICRDGSLDLADVIPFITLGNIFPADTYPEPALVIHWEQEIAALYDAIKGLCDLYDLGFRLVRNFDASQLYFNIYSGNDRTTRQTDLPPVVFGVTLDNLQNTSEFSTIQDTKNVAYVFSSVGFAVVYGDGVDPDIEGFERRVLVVNASDVTEDTVDIPGALEQKGQEELSKHRAQFLFDGEISQNTEYKYGVDYQLGDIVELRNNDGVVTYKRVTEQIMVSDGEGERSYPTLSMSIFASFNTWYAMGGKVWTDFTTEHWDEL